MERDTEGGIVKDTKKPECDGHVHYLDCGGCVSLVYTYDKTHQITTLFHVIQLISCQLHNNVAFKKIRETLYLYEMVDVH